MPLTEAQLQALRQAHRASLRATCDLWRSVPSIDASGSVIHSWALVAQGLPCRVMPENSRRVLDHLAERPASLSLYRLTLPHDADLRPYDRVHYEGRSFRVLTLWDAHSLQSATRAIIAQVD